MASVQQQRQDQQDEHDAVLTVQALEQAVSRIFQNSFDADSKTCLLTLMKVLDNILHKPGDDRVRCIRLSNAAFWNKVARRPGGVDFLLACGFTRQSVPPPLGGVAVAAATDEQQDVLVLQPQQEKQSRLLTARRLLRQRAITDLHCQPEELPPLREPPKIVVSSSSSSSTGDTNNNNNNNNNINNNTFNPYVGHRYDGLSAAVGTHLGPPTANHVSRTTVQLTALQTKKAQLEAAAAQALGSDRQWRAYYPAGAGAGEAVPITTTTTSTPPNQQAPPPSDAALLARRAKAQQAERQQREQGGFTTAAMRQVKALQSKKVYSHVQITIVFADQSKVSGKFLPHETVGCILQSLREHCFVVSPNNNSSSSSITSTNNNDWQVDLYVAPPRRLLPQSATLEQEGLVPAAKIFASWKVGHAPAPGQAFLQPHLFPKQQAQGLQQQQQQQADNNIGTTAFPTAKPIVPVPAAAVTPTATATVQPKKKKKESRQELMLQRMMGKK